VAAELAARVEPVVDAHFEGRDMGFLSAVARDATGRAPGKVALLTSSREGGALFLLAIGESLDVDAPSAGRAVAAALGGRGGGSGRLYQGKAESLSGRDAALAALRAAFAR
jgi:alanyl-tRNA synthetase